LTLSTLEGVRPLSLPHIARLRPDAQFCADSAYPSRPESSFRPAHMPSLSAVHRVAVVVAIVIAATVPSAFAAWSGDGPFAACTADQEGTDDFFFLDLTDSPPGETRCRVQKNSSAGNPSPRFNVWTNSTPPSCPVATHFCTRRCTLSGYQCTDGGDGINSCCACQKVYAGRLRSVYPVQAKRFAEAVKFCSSSQ
jgi:hypothetical protein